MNKQKSKHQCNTSNLVTFQYTPFHDNLHEMAYKCKMCGSKWFKTRKNNKWRLIWRNKAALGGK